MGERLTEAGPFYIADFRPEWRSRPFISFWRPKNAGYAYPLSWSGRYDADQLKPDYHERIEGRSVKRCAVPCAIVEARSVEPAPGMIDDDAGPVVMNTAANRMALRKARYRIAGRSLLKENPNG